MPIDPNQPLKFDVMSKTTLDEVADRLVTGATAALQTAIRDAASALDGFELTIGPIVIPAFTVKLSKPVVIP